MSIDVQLWPKDTLNFGLLDIWVLTVFQSTLLSHNSSSDLGKDFAIDAPFVARYTTDTHCAFTRWVFSMLIPSPWRKKKSLQYILRALLVHWYKDMKLYGSLVLYVTQLWTLRYNNDQYMKTCPQMQQEHECCRTNCLSPSSIVMKGHRGWGSFYKGKYLIRGLVTISEI